MSEGFALIFSLEFQIGFKNIFDVAEFAKHLSIVLLSDGTYLGFMEARMKRDHSGIIQEEEYKEID